MKFKLCKSGNRFNDQVTRCEVVQTVVASLLCIGFFGALAVWFFSSWAKQAGL